MKKTLHIITGLAAMCITAGCIEEYIPRLDTMHESILVVDGIITDGETMIRLSRSSGLEIGPGFSFDDDFSPLWVTRATVWIETESGQRLEQTREAASGRYYVTTGLLDENEKYRVKVRTTDGMEYQSAFRAPQPVPTIDQIEFYHPEGEEPVQVRIDATGNADYSGYYRWSYQETWEVRTYYRAYGYFGRSVGDYWTSYSIGEAKGLGLPWFLYDPGFSPFYTGWISRTSQSLLLGETSRLSQNIVRDHTLYQFGVSDNRISVLYHTKIIQHALGKDAYYYMDNLRRNTDETGSIFAPIPSEMPGNLVCVTNPDVPVIGFVEASRQEEKEIFLPRVESPYIAPRSNCSSVSEGDAIVQGLVHLVPYTGEPGSLELTERVCMDCRVLGATPVRPAWWPANN